MWWLYVYIALAIIYSLYNAFENVPKYLNSSEYKPDRSQTIAVWVASLIFGALAFPISLGIRIYGRIKK